MLINSQINAQDKDALGVLEFGGDVQVLPGSSVFPGGLGRVDGILGMNVLSGCTLFLDSASGWITLWSPRSLTARERLEIGMGDAVEVPLVQAEHNILQARTRFNDSEDVLLAIDTGAELTSIPAQSWPNGCIWFPMGRGAMWEPCTGGGM